MNEKINLITNFSHLFIHKSKTPFDSEIYCPHLILTHSMHTLFNQTNTRHHSGPAPAGVGLCMPTC